MLRPNQVCVFIEFATRNGESCQRIERIVLDDGDDATTATRHSRHLRHEGHPVRGRDVVNNATREGDVEGIVGERQSTAVVDAVSHAGIASGGHVDWHRYVHTRDLAELPRQKLVSLAGPATHVQDRQRCRITDPRLRDPLQKAHFRLREESQISSREGDGSFDLARVRLVVPVENVIFRRLIRQLATTRTTPTPTRVMPVSFQGDSGSWSSAKDAAMTVT
jgi:hypothetical protein